VVSLLLNIVNLAFFAFDILLLARILISWVQLDPYNPVVQFLHNATEPFLAPVRRRLPPFGMFDFSPLAVLVIAWVLQQVLNSLIVSLFVR
jgi:YggT family protein